MKLEPIAKPVRIRIMSGGEEHSSLESLKKNFSVRDLSDAVEDKRLSRWLKQQNQNEMAEGVLRYQGRMKSLSNHDYFDFIKLFFANEPNIETVTDDCSLAAFFHDNDKWKKNFERIYDRYGESQRQEKCKFLKGFSALLKRAGNLSEAKRFLLESAQIGDKESAEILFMDADFRTAKTLYETNKEIFLPTEWKQTFEKFEGKLGETDKIEYYTFLYKFYSNIGNKELSEKCRQECLKRGKVLFPVIRADIVLENSLHPDFSRLLNNDIEEYNIRCLIRAILNKTL